MYLHFIILFLFPVYFYAMAQNNSSLENPVLNRKGRWSIFYPFEPLCIRQCRSFGKPYGQLQGTVCRCFCPRPETSVCAGQLAYSCASYCRTLGFHLGGDCISDPDCFCKTTLKQKCT